MRFWTLLAFFLIGLCPRAALSDLLDSVEIEFQRAPFSKDLTQQTVIQTFQDSRGLLWFVTQEGLNKYNGYELENYRFSPSDPTSLSTDRVTGIAEDSSGDLWISTLGGGLNKYNPIKNSFTALTASPESDDAPYSNDIYVVYSDIDGDIWLGYQGGLSKLNISTGKFTNYISGMHGVPPIGTITSFTQTGDGTLWAATADSGILEINSVTGSFSLHQHQDGDPNSLSSNAIYQVIADDQNNIWASSPISGVSVYNPLSKHVTNYQLDLEDSHTLSSNQVNSIYLDNRQNIWAGTSTGLNLFLKEKNQFSRYSIQSSDLPSDKIYSVFQSKEGKYWIGTYFGLATGTPTLFKKIDGTTGGLSSESVNAFAITRDGTLWVGTDDGLNGLSDNQDYFTWINESTSPSISNATVMSLLAEDDILWVGTYSGGLNRIDLEKNSTKVYKKRTLDKSSIGENGITSILRTDSGVLIVGTFGGGISIYQPETDNFKTHQHDPYSSLSISNDNVIALYQDSLGMIWVGTENGLNRFNLESGEFEHFYAQRENSQSMSSDMVWAFYEDDEKGLWLGTRGGGLNLWSYNDRKISRHNFLQYSDDINLPSSNIYGIQKGQNGNLWLSHNRGVTKFNPATLKSHQYGIRDGLQDTEFNMGASFRSKKGEVYFGGNRGYNVIASNIQRDFSPPPQVSISEIRIMNERVELDKPYYKLDSLELDYEDKMVSIEFFAADYSNPDLVKYAYKLEGINTEWVYSNDSRTASFTTLPAGDYVLKIAAASPDGIWNWSGLSLPINVKPPLWLSSIAYMSYIASALFILIYIVQRQRQKSALVLKRQRELESMVDERTVDLQESRLIAEAASKAKSEFLATMSHEIRTPMHGMIGMNELLLHTKLSDQQKRYATAANNSGKALLDLINDILDFSKIEASKVELDKTQFNLVELIDEVCYLQGEPAQRKSLDLNNILGDQLPNTVIGDPTKIRQVVMNLISNAIKFTHKGQVNIRTRSEKDNSRINGQTVFITVEDSGIGMDEVTQRNVFEAFTQADASTTRKYGGTGLGLAISRHYIDLMGGDISVESSVDKGTEITISIPVTTPLVSKPRNTNSELKNIRVIVQSKKKATREMICSHLDLLEIRNVPVSEIPENFKDDTPDTLYILEDSPLPKEHNESGLWTLDTSRVIFLTSLSENHSLVGQANYRTLTKPTSIKSLEEVVFGELTLSKSTQTSSSNRDITNRSQSSKRVLVAEDVETNQKIAIEMIQLLGCNVDIANDGQDAIGMYEEGNYDLILMDCQMPNIDGFEATKRIRAIELDQGIVRIPIIALTAGITTEDELNCSAAGMDSYITKPYSITDISSVLKEFIGHDNGIGSLDRPKNDSTLQKIDNNEGSNSSGRVINISAITNIQEVEKQTGRPVLPTVFQGFQSQLIEKLKDIAEEFQIQDEIGLGKTAHAIKSMSANIGAEKVRATASEIENKARKEDFTDIESLIKKLEASYVEFSKLMEEEVLSSYE
ncbi:MAG: two-component regulator propeller domain-containing protein [Halioglobus sp.]